MKFDRIVRSLVYSSLASNFLLFVRILSYRDLEYWYLSWNLLLAWIPLLFTILLVLNLKKIPWISWQNIGLTFLWLVFLPNAFYIATDFIHLQQASSETLLVDLVLILSFTLNGLILGYLSVVTIHQQLIKRISKLYSRYLIVFVFLLCSFAIYLGRYLRWNTWDILINPAGILFDVSDRVINPSQYQQTYQTTALFFVFLITFYYVVWQFYQELKNKPKK